MVETLVISALTILLMIASIIFLPTMKIGKWTISPYWAVALGGALLLMLFGAVNQGEITSGFLSDSAINPVKILTLFLSFTIFSIFLDEIGFFSYMAAKAALRAKHSQRALFTWLYVATSVLTVFTANDIVILTLTPFIIYFAKNAKINPLPYLVMEFVAANTWSMLLVIGNPTNIYLATSFQIDFIGYFLKMALPTISAGLLSYGLMRFIFRKSLDAPLDVETTVKVPPKGLLIIGVIHLTVSTVLISVASYIGLEMWLFTFTGAISLFLTTLVYLAIIRQKPTILLRVLKRIPYALAPFMLSMTIFVIALDKQNVPLLLAQSLMGLNPLFSFGFSSFLFANVMNNIPMSILFTEVLGSVSSGSLGIVYATIIGSNIGAILSPIGALAGIMWMSILKREGIKYSYGTFLRYGLGIAVPLILISILSLSLLF